MKECNHCDMDAAGKHNPRCPSLVKGGPVTATTPFLHADVVYGRAMRLLEKWGAANWEAQLRRHKHKPGRKLPPCPAPTQEMVDLIEALDRGDEERIKGILLAVNTREFYEERK